MLQGGGKIRIRLGGKQNIMAMAGPNVANDRDTDDQSSSSDEETVGTEQSGKGTGGSSKLTPIVISKRTRYKPKPGESGKGEVQVFSYSQIQNKMKEKHYRFQTQDDLKHVKINHRLVSLLWSEWQEKTKDLGISFDQPEYHVKKFFRCGERRYTKRNFPN